MANGSKFTWNQESVNNLVHDAASEVRVVRPLLKLYGKQDGYTTNIFGHPIKGASTLSIPATNLSRDKNNNSLTQSCIMR